MSDCVRVYLMNWRRTSYAYPSEIGWRERENEKGDRGAYLMNWRRTSHDQLS
jgi:hypothetical protein